MSIVLVFFGPKNITFHNILTQKYRTYLPVCVCAECPPLGTLSWSQIPKNDTLSWSKIFKNNTLFLHYFKETRALPCKIVGSLSENLAMQLNRYLNHTCVVQMAHNDVTESAMDPVMEMVTEKNNTLSWTKNPENDTLFSGTSPYGEIYECPSPQRALFGIQLH